MTEQSCTRQLRAMNNRTSNTYSKILVLTQTFFENFQYLNSFRPCTASRLIPIYFRVPITPPTSPGEIYSVETVIYIEFRQSQNFTLLWQYFFLQQVKWTVLTFRFSTCYAMQIGYLVVRFLKK